MRARSHLGIYTYQGIRLAKRADEPKVRGYSCLSQATVCQMRSIRGNSFFS